VRLDARHGGVFVDEIGQSVTEHGAERVSEFVTADQSVFSFSFPVNALHDKDAATQQLRHDLIQCHRQKTRQSSTAITPADTKCD